MHLLDFNKNHHHHPICELSKSLGPGLQWKYSILVLPSKILSEVHPIVTHLMPVLRFAL